MRRNCSKEGLITESSVIKIQGIKHAQYMEYNNKKRKN